MIENVNITALAKVVMNATYGRLTSGPPGITKGYDSHQKQKHNIRVVAINDSQLEEMKQWVSDTFGPKVQGWWNPRWSYAPGLYLSGTWHFKYEADAAFFMLRWL